MKNFTDEEAQTIVGMAILLRVGSTIDVDSWNSVYDDVERFLSGRQPRDMIDTFVDENGHVGIRLSTEFMQYVETLEIERELERIEEEREAFEEEVVDLMNEIIG